MRALMVLVSLFCVTTPLRAEQRMLTPSQTQVAIRIDIVGLVPVEGLFDRFEGRLDFDSARPGACQIRLRIEAASLATTSETVREEAVGPGFLDSARFPIIGYEGACDGDAILGQLDMHGVTRPFALALDRSGPLGVAAGALSRSEWGMNERRWLVGDTIRIAVTTPLLAVAPMEAKR